MSRVALKIAQPTASMPRALQLATLVDAPPEGDEWFHEQKFDGYRIVAELEAGQVRLLSRRFKDWTPQFPTISQAVARLPVHHAILDGEVAVLMPDGRTSFQGLQNSFSGGAANLVFFVFDLLALDDESLVTLPLEERKARLAALVKRSKSTTIRYSDHVIGNGAAFFRLACENGPESSLGRAEICRRGLVRRVDQRRSSAPPVVSGIAPRQAGSPGHPRASCSNRNSGHAAGTLLGCATPWLSARRCESS